MRGGQKARAGFGPGASLGGVDAASQRSRGRCPSALAGWAALVFSPAASRLVPTTIAPDTTRLRPIRRRARRRVTPPPNRTGGAWQPANPSDGMLKGKWWEIYQDPQLNQLEERIATNNVN